MKKEDAEKYRNGVDSVFYFLNHLRPDLEFPATYLCQFWVKTSETHRTDEQDTLRYLNGA